MKDYYWHEKWRKQEESQFEIKLILMNIKHSQV